VVNEIVADALAVCVDNNTKVAELAALSKDVTSSTVVLVTALAVSMPDEPMLFAKLLVIEPIILFRISRLFLRLCCLNSFEI
jgi:hypothetical protein